MLTQSSTEGAKFREGRLHQAAHRTAKRESYCILTCRGVVAMSMDSPPRPAASRSRCQRHHASRKTVQSVGGAWALHVITIALIGIFINLVIKATATKLAAVAIRNQSRVWSFPASTAATIVTKMPASRFSKQQVFIEKGYAAATMPAIARTAGMALDTVYADCR